MFVYRGRCAALRRGERKILKKGGKKVTYVLQHSRDVNRLGGNYLQDYIKERNIQHNVGRIMQQTRP